MRILQISSARTFGGGERHFTDLCRELHERGHDVFAAIRPTNEWEKRLDMLPLENILHVSIRNSFGVLSAKRISDFVRENDIQIVHAHVARDYIPASIACSLSGRAKFILTRHLLFPLKPFNRFALKNLARGIGVSAGVGRSLEKVLSKEKIAIIPNGIAAEANSAERRLDLGLEFRRFHGIDPKASLIGIVGELVELKGQRDLVLAANEIIKTNPNAFFLIVGKDNTIDKRFRRELKRLIEVFRIEDRFLWLDWVEDIENLFSALDILVSASHSESFGMAILEAMFYGAAVVATETEGAREIIKDREMLVPVGSPVLLAEKINWLLSDPERLREKAAEAELHAREHFSLKRMVDDTERLYAEVLQNASIK